MKDAVVAKLCNQTKEMYDEVLNLFQKEIVHNLWDKEWIPVVSGKQAGYHALAEYYQSLVCKSRKLIGEEIARLDVILIKILIFFMSLLSVLKYRFSSISSMHQN